MSVQVPPGGKGLTLRQAEVLSAIEVFIRDHGFPPTVRELGALIGTKSPNGVICILDAIERKGHLSRDRNKSRSLRLIDGRQEETLGELATRARHEIPVGALIQVCFVRAGTFIRYEHDKLKSEPIDCAGDVGGAVNRALEQVQMIEAARQQRGLKTTKEA